MLRDNRGEVWNTKHDHLLFIFASRTSSWTAILKITTGVWKSWGLYGRLQKRSHSPISDIYIWIWSHLHSHHLQALLCDFNPVWIGHAGVFPPSPLRGKKKKVLSFSFPIQLCSCLITLVPSGLTHQWFCRLLPPLASGRKVLCLLLLAIFRYLVQVSPSWITKRLILPLDNVLTVLQLRPAQRWNAIKQLCRKNSPPLMLMQTSRFWHRLWRLHDQFDWFAHCILLIYAGKIR